MLSGEMTDRKRREIQKAQALARIRERQLSGDFERGLTVKIPMYVSPWFEDEQGIKTRFVRAL